MFHLLVPRFKEGFHQTDDQGDTALLRIIKNFSTSQDQYGSTKILLSQSGVNWSSYSWNGQQNPLRVAVQLGDLDMCCLLINIGNMDPHSDLAFDIGGQMDLEDKNPENKENMLQVLRLLCTHAKVGSTSA